MDNTTLEWILVNVFKVNRFTVGGMGRVERIAVVLSVVLGAVAILSLVVALGLGILAK